MQNLYEDLA
jgi:hypothetical protein